MAYVIYYIIHDSTFLYYNMFIGERGLKSRCHGVRENSKKAKCMICFDSKNQWISDWPGPTTL